MKLNYNPAALSSEIGLGTKTQKLIKPSEVGTKYIRMNGFHNAQNRKVNSNHVRKLARKLNSVRFLSDIILIIDDEETKNCGHTVYRIVDGQHTLEAVVLVYDTVFFPKVTIYTIADVEAMDMTVRDMVTLTNKGKSFGHDDHLKVHEELASDWVETADTLGLDIVHGPSRNHITWLRAVQAFLWGQKILKTGKMIGQWHSGATSLDRELEGWESTSLDEIKIFLKAIHKWEEHVASHFVKDDIYAFRTPLMLTIAYIIYSQNPTRRADVFFKKVRSKVSWTKVKEHVKSRTGVEALRTVLCAGNHGRPVKTCFTFHEVGTGREVLVKNTDGNNP